MCSTSEQPMSQWFVCKRLANEGCKITGIDLSTELIEQAKQINLKEQLPINYLIGNVCVLQAKSRELCQPLFQLGLMIR